MPYRKDPRSFPASLQQLIEHGAKNPPWSLNFDALNADTWPRIECGTPQAAHSTQVQIYAFLRACGAYYRENPEGINAKELSQIATDFRRAWNILTRGSKVIFRPAIIGDPERNKNYQDASKAILALKLPERPQDFSSILTFIKENNSVSDLLKHCGYKDFGTAMLEFYRIANSFETSALPFYFSEDLQQVFIKEHQ